MSFKVAEDFGCLSFKIMVTALQGTIVCRLILRALAAILMSILVLFEQCVSISFVINCIALYLKYLCNVVEKNFLTIYLKTLYMPISLQNRCLNMRHKVSVSFFFPAKLQASRNTGYEAGHETPRYFTPYTYFYLFILSTYTKP